MKYIGIIGSRRRNTHHDYWLTEKKILSVYKLGDILVSGGCEKGGDKFAEAIAKERGFPILIYYPDWSVGKFAGLLRNTLIADNSSILIACVAKDRTGGTEDTIRKFKKVNEDWKSKLFIV